MTTPLPPPDPGGESLPSRVDAKSPPILGGKGVVRAPFPKAYLAGPAAGAPEKHLALLFVGGKVQSEILLPQGGIRMTGGGVLLYE